MRAQSTRFLVLGLLGLGGCGLFLGTGVGELLEDSGLGWGDSLADESRSLDTAGGEVLPVDTAPPVDTEPPIDTGVEDVGDWAYVSAGWAHSCGVKKDGRVLCWGLDEYGQASPPAETMSIVSAGETHSCGIKLDGTAACWGYDSVGTGDLDVPEGTWTVVEAAWGQDCVGLRPDGSLEFWGRAVHEGFGNLEGTYVAVDADSYFACGIDRGGTISCWSTYLGGDFRAEAVDETPTSGRFLSLELDGSQACAVDASGSILCWGHGSTWAPSGTFAAVDVGQFHKCALRGDGTVTCWGDEDYLGPSVFDVPKGARFKQISAGGWHSCGVTVGGRALCWGWDYSGQSTPPE